MTNNIWRNKRTRNYVIIILLLIYMINFVIAIQTGVRSDYVWYLTKWKEILSDKNPYYESLTYGPVHNLLSFFVYFNDLGPKIFMLTLFFISLFILCITASLENRFSFSALIFLLLNPLVIITTSVNANNDTLVASFLCLTLSSIFLKREKLFILFASFMILTKLTAAPLIIFLICFRNSPRLKHFLQISCLVLLGYFLTGLKYGFLNVLFATLKAGNANTSLLSPLEALKYIYYDKPDSYSSSFLLLLFKRVTQVLIHLNIAVLVYVIAMSIIFFLINKLDFVLSALVSILSTLSVYNMVHPQYFIIFFILLFALNVNSTLFVTKKLMPITTFLALYDLGLVLSNNYSTFLPFAYHNGGLVYFPLLIFTLARLMESLLDRKIKLEDFNLKKGFVEFKKL